jgi:hypothetical protein
MYTFPPLFPPPRCPFSSSMDSNVYQSGDRSRTAPRGHAEGSMPLSLRYIRSAAPYPLPGFPPRTPTGSQHNLSHHSAFPRGFRRSNRAPQPTQCGWHTMAPSQGTTLRPTDSIHHAASINTAFTPNIGAETDPSTLSNAGETRENWGWTAAGELGTFPFYSPFYSPPSARYVILSSWLFTASLLAHRLSVAPLPIFPPPSGFSAGDDGSSSIQQAGVLSSTTQGGQIEPHLHPGTNIAIPHPAANAAPLPIFDAPSGLSGGGDGSSSIQQAGALSSTMQGQIEAHLHTGPHLTIPHPSTNATPLPIFDTSSGMSAGGDGSSSIQHASVLSSTTQGGSIEAHLHTGSNTIIPDPATNAAGPSSNVENTIQETEQVFRGLTSTHPPIIDDWVPSFNEWFPRQQQVFAQAFDEWLQSSRLPSSLGLDNAFLPPCWNEALDDWLQRLLKPDMQSLDASHGSAHTPMTIGSHMFSTPPSATLDTLDVNPSCPMPSSRRHRKRDPDAVSRLTVPEIQEACRRNEGVDDSVISRIAVVFPDGDVSRKHLKLTGLPGSSAGDQRGHHGYMEFAGRRMVPSKSVKKRRTGAGGFAAGQVQRYFCKLCGVAARPRWKNSKDLLSHVWDIHCDPQGDSKSLLSFRNTRETDDPYTAAVDLLTSGQ